MRGVTFIAILVLALACGATGGRDATTDPDRGAEIYATYCMLCHGKDGRLGVNGAKDLTASTLTREEMLVLVTNGRNLMQPFRGVLTEAEIAAVVDHVRGLGEPKAE
jgi:cytochrome c6